MPILNRTNGMSFDALRTITSFTFDFKSHYALVYILHIFYFKYLLLYMYYYETLI